MEQRIQKILARSGYGSRRVCEELIRSGRVSVNGKRATLGQKADQEYDLIAVDGTKVQPQAKIYIKLNKPKGVLSSTVDELNQGRQTITDLVDAQGHIFPVGRLDKQSEGLIILTNDGELTYKLTHPSFGHKKVYRVILEGELPTEYIERWQEGVYLDAQKTAPARVEILQRKDGETRLKIVLQEGRKRQIRRIAASFGYPVKQLIRLQIGPIKLGDLEPGQWKHLANNEVQALLDSVAS